MDANPAANPFDVTTPDALAALYPAPTERVLTKTGDRLEGRSAAFIASSPFFILSTSGRRGPHATPRGDAAGFATLLDEKTLALPDRRGNNRLDALRDVLDDPRVALLFFVPGIHETLRVHGLARITTDPALHARMMMGRTTPATVLVVSVTEVYIQCPRALLRGGLWSNAPRPAAAPTAGELLAEHTGEPLRQDHYDNVVGPQCATELY